MNYRIVAIWVILAMLAWNERGGKVEGQVRRGIIEAGAEGAYRRAIKEAPKGVKKMRKKIERGKGERKRRRKEGRGERRVSCSFQFD